MKTTIKRFLVALLVLAPLIATAQVILRQRTYSNVTIPNGEAILPDTNGVGVPKQSASARVEMTATNWPVPQGVTLEIEYTFGDIDPQTHERIWESCWGPQLINKPPVGKTGILPPVAIGCNWSTDPNVHRQPVAGRLVTINEAAGFSTTIDLFFLN